MKAIFYISATFLIIVLVLGAANNIARCARVQTEQERAAYSAMLK